MNVNNHNEPTIHRWHIAGAMRQNNYGTVLGIIFGLLLLLCLFVTFKTPADKWATCIALGVVVALCFLPMVFGLLFRPTTVKANYEGLAWHGLFGSGERGWVEVVDVYRKDILNVSNARGYTKVTFQGGPTLSFGQALTGYEQLADRIQDDSLQAGIANARTALTAGEYVAGPLTLRTEGLSVGKVNFSWADLNGYMLINGQLFFLGSSPKLDEVKGVLLHQVPNYLLILQLLKERGLVFQSWSPDGGLSPTPQNDSGNKE